MVGNYFSPNEITPDDYHVKWKLFETLESKKEDNIAIAIMCVESMVFFKDT